MSKPFYPYIFVILTYRNVDDLDALLGNIGEFVSKDRYRAVVVNAYYDDITSEKVRETAEKYDADFLNQPNKGYSYGNHRGMEYAAERYAFDWLIVANPDTLIQKFDESIFDKAGTCVMAPKIVNLRGKRQNPMMKRFSPLKERLVYKGCLQNRPFYFYAGIAWGKVVNAFTRCKSNKRDKRLKKIEMAHGSFVIFAREVLEQLGAVYDENIFLFSEESVLARRLQGKFATYYTDAIAVLHKEDGSMKYEKDSISKNVRDANIYYYETYGKGK